MRKSDFSGSTTRALAFLCALLLAVTVGGCNAAKQSGLAQRTQQAMEDARAMDELPNSPAHEALAESNDTAEADSADAPTPRPTVNFAVPLSLEDCVEYALHNNLEALVAAQEKRVQQELERGRLFSMLPSLLLQVERSQQDPYTPSSSRSFSTGTTSLEPSISEDLFKQVDNLTLSWDLLNLTMNVFRYQQEGQRTAIAGYRLERVKQDVALEITRAYMRGAVALDLRNKAAALIQRAKERQAVLDRMLAADVISKNDWLQSHIEMNELNLQMQSFEEEYELAKARIAELLGRRNNDFDLAGYTFELLPTMTQYDTDHLERVALSSRPELFEKDSDEAIMRKDSWIALASMFPTIKPFVTLHQDQNSFLLRDRWTTYGLELSWELLSVPKSVSDYRAARRREDLEKLRRLQVSMAVITQLRLALASVEDLQDKLPINDTVQEEREELASLVERQIRDGALQESLQLEVDLKYLLARQRYLTNYADLVIAQARVDNSIGLPWGQETPAPGSVVFTEEASASSTPAADEELTVAVAAPTREGDAKSANASPKETGLGADAAPNAPVVYHSPVKAAMVEQRSKQSGANQPSANVIEIAAPQAPAEDAKATDQEYIVPQETLFPPAAAL